MFAWAIAIYATMRWKKRNYVIEKYKCPTCGLVMTIPRTKRRKKGHIKDIYCVRCRQVQKMKLL